MPQTNFNLVRTAKQLEQVKADVRARTERARDDDGNLNSEMFKYRNPDIMESMSDWLAARYEEAETLQRQVDDYTKADTIMSGFDNLDSLGRQQGRRPALNSNGRELSIAETLVKSDVYGELREKRARQAILDHEVGLKALFESSANAADTVNVESIRTGQYVPLPRTRVTIFDVIPQLTTEYPVVKYDVEVANSSAFGDVAQGAIYAESAFQINEVSVNVGKTGAFIQVSEELMMDMPMFQARVNGSLMQQLMRRVQDDIIGGTALTNAGEYVTGAAVSAVQEGFMDLDNTSTPAEINQIDGTGVNEVSAIYQAAEEVYRIGEAESTAILMNSQNWSAMQQLQATTGSFILRGAMNGLSGPNPMMIDQWPVVLCNSLPANTVIIGDFANHCMIRDRQAAQVRIQEAQGVTVPQNPNNTAVYTSPTGRYNVFADVRYAFKVTRGLAFCRIINFGQ